VRILLLNVLALFLSVNAFGFYGTFTKEVNPEAILHVEMFLYNLAKFEDCGDTQCYRMDVYLNGELAARWAASPGTTGQRDFPGEYTPQWARATLNKSRIMGHGYVSRRGDAMPYAMFINYGNGGFAVHAGEVTGRRESHGCVRLQYDKAKLLNSWVRMAMKNSSDPILHISAQDTHP
jgi:hypothetical protein